MEARNQFTFYRSFWEAIRKVPDADRLLVLEAIIGYALDERIPDNLSNTQEALLILCKPTLDASRKKAAAGKKGGSKPKAKRKQKQSKKKKEVENKIENKIEYECITDTDFERFWEIYPRKVGKEKAREALLSCGVPLPKILSSLQQQLHCDQWQREKGRFIPNPATWLQEQRWEDVMTVSSESKVRLPDKEEILAVRRLMKDD